MSQHAHKMETQDCLIVLDRFGNALGIVARERIMTQVKMNDIVVVFKKFQKVSDNFAQIISGYIKHFDILVVL